MLMTLTSMMATYKHREKVYEIPFPQSQSLSAREMGMRVLYHNPRFNLDLKNT